MQHFTMERLDTPTGRMLIVSDNAGRLSAVDWEDHAERMRRLLRRYHGLDMASLTAAAVRSAAARALLRYFAGDLAALADLACAAGGTEFQNRVWSALRRIAPGRTTHYGALAAKLQQPTAARAVGLANGANPIAIVIPCHRVIGADGSLTGYGGGIERKRWLLAHEQAHMEA
ncbi:MAG TPA: methylated-DNA--[protein]-cysteine S-methyltransferase [Ferrovibrio sp.]|uniref:methylated-DNA--[protein]-cysteine S-methyltransferase n=1 Tax=Ferrovibrio sp. TaxID=1917215 RepID=UPI002ED08FCE